MMGCPLRRAAPSCALLRGMMMRSRVIQLALASLATISVAAPLLAHRQPQQNEPGQAQSPATEQVFRAQSEIVVLHVNVFDGRSDAVPGLPQDAFSVVEDGRPQDITFFSSADVPVAVGLVVDNSGSMIARQRMVVTGGTAFARASHPED